MKEAHYLERYCVAWLSGEDVKRTNDSSADFRQFGPHQKAPKENITNKGENEKDSVHRETRPSVQES